MLVVVGGAYAGKRKIVRERLKAVGKSATWLSAYDQHGTFGIEPNGWEQIWEQGTSFVLEGWEMWLREDIEQGRTVEEVRQHYKLMFAQLLIEEKKKRQEIILIMLEMGKGIVPLASEDRTWRDIAGWVLQDAAHKADEVVYVWHGMAKHLKRPVNN